MNLISFLSSSTDGKEDWTSILKKYMNKSKKLIQEKILGSNLYKFRKFCSPNDHKVHEDYMMRLGSTLCRLGRFPGGRIGCKASVAYGSIIISCQQQSQSIRNIVSLAELSLIRVTAAVTYYQDTGNCLRRIPSRF